MSANLKVINHVSGQIKIAFIGNERDLIHAMRGIFRYHVQCTHNGKPYVFFLFGMFPKDLLAGLPCHYQWIGENREEAADFNGEFHVVLDSKQYQPSCGISLTQWFEEQLGLKAELKPSPFYTPGPVPLKLLMEYRLKLADSIGGNTVMFSLPSPQDYEWTKVAARGEALHSWMIALLRRKFTVVVPQIKIPAGINDEAYDHRFYYSGYENDFFKYCLTPTFDNLNDYLFYLLNCRCYVGWDNWLADIAAANYIPSLIYWNREPRDSKYWHPTNEYVRVDYTVSYPEAWHEDYFVKKLHHLEAGLRPLR